jgi:hypothetical protein
MKTIYISGRITGLPFDRLQAKFAAAERTLTEQGYEVISPLRTGISCNFSWESHLVMDIVLLLGCDTIYMLDGWQDSVGACIEYYIAMETGKDIVFESNIVRNQNIVLRIQNAIHEVTGMRFDEYTTKSRKRDGVFARMMFAYHCRENSIKLTTVAKYVHRDHTSILYLLNKYHDEIKFNPYFRDLAQRVKAMI